MPPPGIQAQRPRTRTARTTRQINGAIVVGLQADFWRKVYRPGPTRPTSNRLHLMCQWPLCIVLLNKVALKKYHGEAKAINDSNYNGSDEAKERLRSKTYGISILFEHPIKKHKEFEYFSCAGSMCD